MSISINSFAIVVSAIRAAQKSYFKTRDPHYLTLSKSREKQVDEMTDIILNPVKQTKLFDGK